MSPANVDRTAPVVVETHVEIAAPPSSVWAALTDVGRWPAWNSVIDTAELRGPTAPGSVIHWTTFGMVIDSRLTAVEPERVLDWDGSDGGMRGLHSWHLEPAGAGTRVRNAESMSGGAAAANPAEVTRRLTFMLEHWNEQLKMHVERASVPADSAGRRAPA